MTDPDTPPAGCSHGICLPLAGDGCHLADNTTTARQVLDGLARRDLIARLTRDSLNLGLYDIPAADFPPPV